MTKSSCADIYMSMKEAQRFIGKVANESLQAALFTEIIHTQHIITAKKHLDQGGSVLAIGNHISANDPIAHAKIFAQITTPDHITAVASRRHFDPNQGRFNAVKHTLRQWWEEGYGIDIALVVQKKDRVLYPDWGQYNASTQKRLEIAIKKPGQLVYILPEGERSNENGLLQAEVGVGGLIKVGGDSVLVLPISEDYTDLKLLKGRAKLTIGEPFDYQQLMSEKTVLNQRITELRQQGATLPFTDAADVMMLHIAQPLPPENYGYYTTLMEASAGIIAA